MYSFLLICCKKDIFDTGERFLNGGSDELNPIPVWNFIINFTNCQVQIMSPPANVRTCPTTALNELLYCRGRGNKKNENKNMALNTTPIYR